MLSVFSSATSGSRYPEGFLGENVSTYRRKNRLLLSIKNLLPAHMIFGLDYSQVERVPTHHAAASHLPTFLTQAPKRAYGDAGLLL
jgi:hypothetical protein